MVHPPPRFALLMQCEPTLPTAPPGEGQGTSGLIPDAMTGDHIDLVVATGGRNLDPMIGFGGLNRIDPRFAMIAGLGLALPLALS